MRLLIIISQYLPSQTPNTLRWQPLAQYFIDQGIEVSILTTLHKGFPKEEVIAGAKVYRAGYNTILDKVYDVLGTKNRRNKVYGGPPSSGLLSKLLQGIVDKTWRKNYWPDGSKLFLKPGIKKGQEVLIKDEITQVISVGLPFTAHLIAKSLKESNPSIHWHMDIQDPFCYSEEFWVNNFEKYKQKNIRAEQEAFDSADTISVTNDKAKEKYLQVLSADNSKLTVIPPMFHLGEKEHIKNDYYDMILDKTKIHLAYAGSFYDGVRSPFKFLKFLKFLHEQDPALKDKIQFHFIGQLDRSSYPLFGLYPEIKEYMVLHGFKNRAQTISALSQVDFLLNFGNTTNYHLPSKVVDYLYLNKPIVNLSSVSDDSTQAFFSDYTQILNLQLEQSQFHELSKAFESFVFAEGNDGNTSNGNVETYSATEIGNSYLRLFN